MNGTLNIELLSDMLPGTGVGFGASVNAEVCADALGLPYLPGRRIKGCLRESARFAAQLGAPNVDEATIARLFGTEEAEGALRLENAVLTDAESLRRTIRNVRAEAAKRKNDSAKDGAPNPANLEADWLTPANILNAYSYLRSQTAISEGVAAKNTLRVSRVLRRGLRFECPVECPEALLPAFETCVKAFTEMGTMRTRGLGRIRATFAPKEDANLAPVADENTLQPDERATLTVLFELLTPVVATDTYGEGSNLAIPGSAMRGAIMNAWRISRGLASDADLASEPDFQSLFLGGNVRYAQAVITDEDGNRYARLPASIVKYKDAKVDGFEYLDTALSQSKSLSKSVGERYARLVRTDGNSLTYESPDIRTRVSYHQSSRSGALFQYSALEAGQRFRMEITGSSAQLTQLKEALVTYPTLSIGRSRSAEYGAARVTSLKLIRQTEESASSATNHFVAILASPACLTDDKGMFATDANALLQSLERNLAVGALAPEKFFLRFRTMGGYRPKWRLAKPTTQALDAGTVLTFHIASAAKGKQALPARIWIGGHRNEGLGEVHIMPIEALRPNIEIVEKGASAANLEKKEERPEKVEVAYRHLIVQIAKSAARRQLCEYARIHPLPDSLNSTTVAALLQAVRTTREDGLFAQCLANIADAEKREKVIAALCGEKASDTGRIRDILKCQAEAVVKTHPAIETAGLTPWQVLQIVLTARLTAAKYLKRYQGGKENVQS